MSKNKQPKLTKLLAPTVPLVLEVEADNPERPHRLELDLAWTMRAVIIMESKLRQMGVELNVLQNPGIFWTGIDFTRLALGIWACSQQEQPEYADEEGFDIITSFMTMDNYAAAVKALKDAFLESLTKERREELRRLETEAEQVLLNAQKPAADPTEAQVEK